jgi:hypothetical protein
MKHIIKNILIITAVLVVTQGAFVTFFVMVGSIMMQNMYLTFFLAWILSILSLAIIAEIFGDKKISLTIHDHDNE